VGDRQRVEGDVGRRLLADQGVRRELRLGDALIERASLETSLPNTRFLGERARTCGQLRMFADLLDEGSWVDARIDHAIPHRQPVPKPDVRSMLRPIGPVAVFCASNFPLAYSVAGGDTASALAAGCPVIVNAHIAHPGTAEFVGIAVANAAQECCMPEGVFSLLFSDGYEIGQALVKHPEIKAVGFTGSRRGGRATDQRGGSSRLVRGERARRSRDGHPRRGQLFAARLEPARRMA